MFKKIQCSKCECRYDGMAQNCPKCGEPNPNVPPKKLFGNNTTYFPFWMQIVLFFVGWLGFQALGLILSFIIGGINAEDITKEAILTFSAYGILTCALVGICNKHVVELAKTFKKWLAPVAAIGGFMALMSFNMIYSTFLNALNLGVEDNANETSINSIITVYPVLSILIIGLLGPLCEELTYRVGLFSFFKRINKFLAYGVTLTFFALIHFDFDALFSGGSTLVNELLNLPYYLAAGFVFTFLYDKIGFASGYMAHATNNLASVLSGLIASQLVVHIL